MKNAFFRKIIIIHKTLINETCDFISAELYSSINVQCSISHMRLHSIYLSAIFQLACKIEAKDK